MAQVLDELKGISETTYFATESYDGGIQNYAFSQDPKGVIYVANNLGMLTYDGANWERYPVSNGTKVRSVCSGDSGKVYVGAQNELGYFKPNELGVFEYNSLISQVPNEFKDFNETWSIHQTSFGTAFCTSSTIFLLDQDELKLILHDPKMKWVFYVGGALFCQSLGTGVKVYDGNSWEILSSESIFKSKDITSIIQIDEERLMIATYQDGLYLYDQNRIQAFQSPFQKHSLNIGSTK